MANFKVNDVPSWIQYTATASQTEFSIPFPFIDNSDLSVWQNGILLTLTTDYTLSGAQTASGGQLTLNTGASLNDIITIQDLMVVDRTNIYLPTISALTGSALNNDFNRDVIMIRDLETTVNYLMLQYEPYVPISQDIDVTTDRIIPLLPARNVWRKDPTNMFIQAILLPDNPVGTMSVFTADNRIVTTDLPSGNTYIKQTDLQITSDTITAVSGDLNLVGTNDVNVNTPGDITLSPGGNLVLDGSTWPTSGAAPNKFLGFVASSTQLSWVYGVFVIGTPVDNAIVKFSGSTGMITASNLFTTSNTLYTTSGDLTISAFTGNQLVSNDPTEPLGIATKQYVDTHDMAYIYQNALWVSMATGSDSNAGTSIDTPLLTFEYAVSLAQGTPTIIYIVDNGTNNETFASVSGTACSIIVIAPGVIFNGTYLFQNAGDLYTINCLQMNSLTDNSTNQNTVNCQSINGTTDNSGGMMIVASNYINTYAYSGATGTVYLTAPSITASFSPSNTVTAYIETDNLSSFISVFGASASNYYINATNCPSFSQTGADNFFTNIAVGTPSAGGGTFFGNFGGINYGTSGIGDGTGTIQSYWPATGPSASGQTIISGGAGPGASTSWGTSGSANFIYPTTFWIAQNNGNDANGGNSINLPDLLVQTAITTAENLSAFVPGAIINVVDYASNGENLVIGGGFGTPLTINAQATNFTGNISDTGATHFYGTINTSGTYTLTGANSHLNGYLNGVSAIGSYLYISGEFSNVTVDGTSICYDNSLFSAINNAGTTYYCGSQIQNPTNSGTLYAIAPSLSGSVTNTGNIYGIIGSTYYGLTAITDSVGNNVLTFTDNATPVNYLNVGNAATSFGVVVSAVGSDTDVRLVLASQGMGVINILGGSSVTPVFVMSFTPVASGVNHFDIYSAATGNQPQILARGSDTNVSMSIGSKGNGGVYTQGSTAGTLPASGYVGEIISSNIPVGSSVNLTSGMTINVTSINLTAGNWRLTGNVNAQGGTNSFGTLLVAINSTSATFPDQSYINAFVSSLSSYSNLGLNAPEQIVNITSTTTYYLIAYVSSVSAVTGCGNLIATRLP